MSLCLNARTKSRHTLYILCRTRLVFALCTRLFITTITSCTSACWPRLSRPGGHSTHRYPSLNVSLNLLANRYINLCPNNILLRADDASPLLEIESMELSQTCPCKVLPDCTIYLSYTVPATLGFPVICDFGNARMGKRTYWRCHAESVSGA